MVSSWSVGSPVHLHLDAGSGHPVDMPVVCVLSEELGLPPPSVKFIFSIALNIT